MKNLLLLFLGLILFFAGCKKTEQVISRAVIQSKIDSIYNERKVEIENIARRDLEHRITIEVKVKADSIFRAKLFKIQNDTTKNKKK